MSYVLIVAILAVENGWIIGQDRQSIPVRDRAACEALQKEVDAKMRAENGAQFITICRPRGSSV